MQMVLCLPVAHSSNSLALCPSLLAVWLAQLRVLALQLVAAAAGMVLLVCLVTVCGAQEVLVSLPATYNMRVQLLWWAVSHTRVPSVHAWNKVHLLLVLL